MKHRMNAKEEAGVKRWLLDPAMKRFVKESRFAQEFLSERGLLPEELKDDRYCQ